MRTSVRCRGMPRAPRRTTKAAAPKAAEPEAAEPEEATQRRSNVQSVSRAFALLETLKDSSVRMSALEVARATGLDRTVVHRLLRTLAEHELVVEQRGTYGLGPASVLLAN